MELEVNGEKVKVEKFIEEDWKELYEHERKENLSIEYILVGFVSFEEEKDLEVVYRCMALATYRLLWYFGPPLSVPHTPPRSVYTFSLKYKGFIFKIGDDLKLRWLRIDSVHLVPEGEEFDKQKYVPPKEIKEEITSIVEHLVMTPVEMYAGDYMVPV